MKNKMNLVRKHTVFNLYGKAIKIIGFIVITLITILAFIGCGYLIIQYISLNKLREYLSILIWIWIVMLVAIYVYQYFIYLYHQLYIPLTKEELEEKGITTVEEYNIFLYKYLKHFNPVKKVKEYIIFNSMRYLLTEDEFITLFRANPYLPVYINDKRIENPTIIEIQEYHKILMKYEIDFMNNKPLDMYDDSNLLRDSDFNLHMSAYIRIHGTRNYFYEKSQVLIRHKILIVLIFSLLLQLLLRFLILLD